MFSCHTPQISFNYYATRVCMVFAKDLGIFEGKHFMQLYFLQNVFLKIHLSEIGIERMPKRLKYVCLHVIVKLFLTRRKTSY